MERRVRLWFQLVTLVFALMFLFLGSLAQPDMARGEPYVLKAVTAWPKPVTDNQAFFIFKD